MEGKTNFFEKRVGEYAKANTMNYNDPSSKSFALSVKDILCLYSEFAKTLPKFKNKKINKSSKV